MGWVSPFRARQEGYASPDPPPLGGHLECLILQDLLRRSLGAFLPCFIGCQRHLGVQNPVSCCQDLLRRTIGGGGRHGTLLPGALDALNCFYTVLHRSHTADSHLSTRTRHRWAASRPTDDRTIWGQVAMGYPKLWGCPHPVRRGRALPALTRQNIGFRGMCTF